MTTNYLLDTNALSEASKTKPDAGFIGWFMEANEMSMYTSCVVIGEIKKGISLIQSKEKYEHFDSLLAEVLMQFDSRIINVDAQIALLWGELLAAGQLSGQTAPVVDTLIAAQCIIHNLVLVTRNVQDFNQFTELKTYSPWTK